MSVLSGTIISSYHFIEKLGEGGMAVVYKAFDTRLECEVAVKVVRLENFPRKSEERALKRFSREARVVANLNHPNIVGVKDYGEYEGNPYLVMPYLPGGILKQLIRERGQFSWQEAASLLIPIAEALSYAHSHNVIHRDFKPSNILLTENGTPMLTDFGVAKIVEYEGTQDLTGTSATVGTPEYMAPEQIVSKSVDHRADLYALGVVFYKLVTGRRPYEADTPMAVFFKHASEPLPRASQFVKELPERVEHLLIKILAKKPEDRYQSADEVVKALKALTYGVEVSSTAPVKSEVVHEKSAAVVRDGKGAGKRSPLRWLLAGLGMVALIGAGFGLSKLQVGSTPAALPPLTSIEPLKTKQAITSTPTEKPISTPVMTKSPTNTQTPTITLTPTAVFISGLINKNVNCREGPASYYKTLGIINSGTAVELLGFDNSKNWIFVKLTKATSVVSISTELTCWISEDLLNTDEDTSNLPYYTPMPPNYYVYSLQVTYMRDWFINSYQIININTIQRARQLGHLDCTKLISSWCDVEVFGPEFRNVSDGWEFRIDD